ncbi:MAG TPA: hypothetical protein VHA78_02810 [Candidatus Peribacteraceae bacterium]|nr:hypothetical protein [Candidatus Peribacteraceae bacterium]
MKKSRCLAAALLTLLLCACNNAKNLNIGSEGVNGASSQSSTASKLAELSLVSTDWIYQQVPNTSFSIALPSTAQITASSNGSCSIISTFSPSEFSNATSSQRNSYFSFLICLNKNFHSLDDLLKNVCIKGPNFNTGADAFNGNWNEGYTTQFDVTKNNIRVIKYGPNCSNTNYFAIGDDDKIYDIHMSGDETATGERNLEISLLNIKPTNQ